MSSSAGHERDTADPTSLAPPQPIQDTENSQVDVGRPDSHYAESATNTNAPYIPNSSASGILPDPSIASTPRVASSYGTPTATPNEASSDALGGTAAAATTAAATKEATDVPGSKEALAHPGAAHPARRPWYKRPVFWLLAFIVLAVVVLVVVLPVWFVGVKGHKHTGSSSSASSGGGTTPKSTVTTTGGNGSTVTTDDGSTFTYINDFGGFWVSDPTNPFNNSAQPNSWTPPLSESWNWSKDRIYGVNLGGLFELEPFISPKLYQANPGSLDEWTLDLLLRANGSNGGELGKEEYGLQDVMELHYNEFVTEQDIAEIAGAGLNWIRVPIPFWAIESWSNVGVANGTTVSEPFLAKTCWPYILRLFGWARKYGLRINLDLHTIPGSQNGYNHSGKYGIVNFLNGVMGVANAERALEYIRVITEFITQEEYQPLIPMFGIVNEPLLATITLDTLTTFYLQAYWVMRNITGVGEGNGPYISIHDGFMGTDYWAGFLAGSDRISLGAYLLLPRRRALVAQADVSIAPCFSHLYAASYAL
ncbi:glycoside hydrolase family 5 protein, partial [Laetiporus sulphureus 93-53]